MKTKKFILAALIGASIGLYAFQAGAITLKDNTIIQGSNITLGDIFTDLPRDNDKVLGPAPRPGTDMVLNARTLMRIAIAMDLPWRPSSATDQIVLKRAATVIGRDEIESRLKKEIIENGYTEGFDIEFPQATSEMILPKDQPGSFDIADLKIDRASGKFTATIAAPSKENTIQTNAVSGIIYPVAEVPVLRSTLRKGTIIGQRDIEFITMRADSLNDAYFIDANDIIGMTPRKILIPGKPVTENDIEAPQVVTRGDAIVITLKSGPMTLTAQGKALENGATGDLIRVTSSEGSRTLQALVTGDKEVQISDF